MFFPLSSRTRRTLLLKSPDLRPVQPTRHSICSTLLYRLFTPVVVPVPMLSEIRELRSPDLQFSVLTSRSRLYSPGTSSPTLTVHISPVPRNPDPEAGFYRHEVRVQKYQDSHSYTNRLEPSPRRGILVSRCRTSPHRLVVSVGRPQHSTYYGVKDIRRVGSSEFKNNFERIG